MFLLPKPKRIKNALMSSIDNGMAKCMRLTCRHEYETIGRNHENNYPIADLRKHDLVALEYGIPLWLTFR